MKYIKTYEDESSKIDEARLFMYIRQSCLTKEENNLRNKNCVELIKKGVNVNCQDNRGNTPLIWALDKKNFFIIFKLIDAGADWFVKNDSLTWGWDFIENLNYLNKELIINKYPEKYEEYLRIKDAKKYNL